MQAARRPHVRVRIDQAGHDRLAGDIDRARAGRRFEASLFADAGDPVVGHEDVAGWQHLVAFHRDDPRARQEHRAFRPCARQLDDDLGLLRLVGIDGLLEELRAPRPGDRLAVGCPLQIVAAFGRHALDRHRGVVAAARDANVDRLATGHRNRDEEMAILQADERAGSVRRHANLASRSADCFRGRCRSRGSACVGRSRPS